MRLSCPHPILFDRFESNVFNLLLNEMDRSFQTMRDRSQPGSAFWPSSNKKNAFVIRSRTPTGGSSRVSLSGRSSLSVQVISRTRQNEVKAFGLPLPVLVTEALTFADRSTAVSARISPNGWAWLVCGRRLLIWQYKQSPSLSQQRRPPSTQCRELTLPPSELAHRADLVWVYTREDSPVPACIAVSPEGTVRFWPSVAYEGTSVEDTTDLQGQECDSLTCVASLGCILATTTSTIVRLQPEVSNGRHCVTCITLKPPQSLLGGIGRRMSSLIFGSLPTAGAAEAKLVRVASVEKSRGSREQEFTVYVLTEHTLQKWSITATDIEKLIFECEVGRRIREAFQEKVWDPQGGNPDDQESWLLDMQPTGDGVAILAVSVHPQISQNMQFAIATISTDLGVPPTRLKSFSPLKNEIVPRKPEQDLSQYQLLIAGHSALVYSHRNVLVYQLSNLLDDPDTIEFRNEGDGLLGASVCANVPVFFSKSHGLVSISPLDYSPNDFSSQNDSTVFGGDASVSEFGDISVLEQDLEELTTHQNIDARMKAAFLYHVSKNQAQCEAIVRELLPRKEIPLSDIDSPIDVAAVKVSQDLINDIPARDPRWVDLKTSNISLSSSTSLHILRQLEQKQHALDLYFNFLVDLKLWERFSAVVSLGVVMATIHVLAEQAEKLVAAIALHQLQSDHGTLIDTAIGLALEAEKEKPTGKLNAKDLFYRKVSGIHRAIQVLVRWSDDQVHSECSPGEVARQLSEVNDIILEVLGQVIQYRQQKAEIFQPKNRLEVGLCEYLPWTASTSPSGGLRDSLMNQQLLSLKYGARSTGDTKLKAKLYDQVLNLVDIILDGKKCHLESVRESNKHTVLFEQYQKERSALIQPFVEDREFERAIMLAEKYYDFQTLVQICDITNNRDRLDVYIEKFKDHQFSQFLFSWYIQEQKPGRLLETFRAGSGLSSVAQNAAQQEALARFLGDHPSLSWLQQVFLHDFQRAADTLTSLAQEEKELLKRKKSMLSLAKLSLLASGEAERPNQRALLDAELDLVAHQEDLPESVLMAYGYDIDQLHVLPPGDLIQLLICNENQSANEFTFKKALDLLEHEENEKSELRHKIWCQAILRDDWKGAEADIPLNVVQKTIFYKLVALIDFMDFTGQSLKELVPPKEKLLDAKELEKLPDQDSFKYLLSVAYEHFEHILAKS